MSIVKTCLFPVAGYGTRFLPATKAIPKEMLPILNKPLVQYGVEEAMNSDINNIAMVVSKHKQAIKQHFEVNADIEMSIKGTPKEPLLDKLNHISKNCNFLYTEQKEMLGLGHAIYLGKSLVGNEPFAVILPDDLCISDNDPVLLQMIKVYKENPDCCIVAIQKVQKKDVGEYGIIDGKLLEGSSDVYRVTSMIEKPSSAEAPTDFAIIGRYILTPEVFSALEEIGPGKNGEIQITDALIKLANEGKVLAYKFKGKRYDCGSVKGFAEASADFAKSKGLI